MLFGCHRQQLRLVGFGWGLDFLMFGFGGDLSLVEACISLEFGFSWVLNLVEDLRWLGFGYCQGYDLVEVCI